MKGRKAAKSTTTRTKSRVNPTASSRSVSSGSLAKISRVTSVSSVSSSSVQSATFGRAITTSRSMPSSSSSSVAQRRSFHTTSSSREPSFTFAQPAMTTGTVNTRISRVDSAITTSIRTQVTAALVKKLRESTGAPMIECKKALTAVFDSDEYDTSNETAAMSSANEYLRKRGTALLAKNAGRSTLEGAVAFVINKEKTKGVILEVNCETDFVARNGTFLGYASRTALTVLHEPVPQHTVDQFMQNKKINIHDFANTKLVAGPSAMPSNPDAQNNTISQELIDVVNNCRENIKLRRAAIVNIEDGVDGFIGAYIHNELPVPEEFKPFHDAINQQGYTLRLGNAGALGAFKLGKKPESGSVVDDAELMDLGRKIMMQTVAASPEYLHRSMVPEHLIEKEKEIMLAVTDTTGKDPKIIDRLLQGKLGKFFEGVVLLDQQFIVTNDTKKPTVSDLLEAHPTKPQLVSVARYLRGETVEGEAPLDAPTPQ